MVDFMVATANQVSSDAIKRRSSAARMRHWLGDILSELETIKNIISRAFFVPVSSIADDAEIRDIKGMDSLTFEALILEIERVSGQEPDPVSLMQIKTVSDLARLIEEMKAGKAS